MGKDVRFMLTSQNYHTLLKFAYDIPTESDGFFRNILRLFEVHFGVRVSLLLTCPVAARDCIPQWEEYRYIVRNLLPAIVKTYFSKFFQSDAFSQWIQTQHENVVSLTTLLSEEQRAQSAYLQYLHSLGITSQAFIFLEWEQHTYAAISLFRHEDEGDFTPEELQMFSILARLITKQYLQTLSQNQATFLLHHFDSYFSNLDLGVALLNSHNQILIANQAFSEYSQYIISHGPINDDIVTSGTVNSSPAYLSGQKLVNYYGHHIITNPQKIKIECLLYRYQFHTKSIHYQSGADLNSVEYQHLTFLTRQEKIESPALRTALKHLTSRELVVVSNLASGMSNAEIAEAMSISQFTVKTHLQNIYSKCNVSGRSELISQLK